MAPGDRGPAPKVVRLRHRALCDTCDYKSPWREKADEAYEDAARHRSSPGNGDHRLRIITEQTVSTRFTE